MEKRFLQNSVITFMSIIFLFITQAVVFAQDTPLAIEQEGGGYAEQITSSSNGFTQDSSGEITQNVTLDFKDADILLVLRLLSLKSGVNIVAGPEVTGTVTIRLNDVAWDKALDIVLRTYGYVYERDGNIIRVSTRENLAAEELVTETFVLNYSTAQEISDAIAEIISERGRIKSVNRTNMVIVTDIATNIYKIGEIIKRLDRRTPQVYIDSTIIQTSQSNIQNLGITWSTTASVSGAERGFTAPWKVRHGGDYWGFKDFFPTDAVVEEGEEEDTDSQNITTGTMDFSTFTATLNFLKSFATTKIISNPRIVVLSNQTAKVQVGEEIGIPNFERNESTGSVEVTGYDTRDTGVVLNVIPHVNDAHEILVELKPEVSSFAGWQDVTDTLAAPNFNTIQAETQVLIKDGETIAIGGLVRDRESGTKKKIPFLGDIPGVGRLFRSDVDDEENTENEETLFFVTVTIVDTEGQPEYGTLS